MDTTVRLMRLLALLQSRPHWSGDELAERLGVSTRTVRSDVWRLRALDYRVDARPGTAGGYHLHAGTTLPPMRFDDGEAIAVAVGLRVAATAGLDGIAGDAARATTKLDQLLPPRLRARLRTITGAAEAVPHRRDQLAPAVFGAISTAIDRHEQLRFDYTDRRETATRRTTEPHRLLFVSGRWYLVGYDLEREAWRSFRADRIIPTVPTGPRFIPRPLPEPDLATFVTRGRMAAMWTYTATVHVAAPVDTVAARIPGGVWTVRAADQETSVLQAGAQTPQLLAAYLAAMDLDFTVDDRTAPELAAEISKIAARYAEATPAHPPSSPAS